MKKTVLVDSNYLCHRAMHSTNNMRFNGIRTGIVFGFFQQLITLATTLRPDQFIFFWDSDSKASERKKLLPIYKEKPKKELSEAEQEERKMAFAQFTQLRRTILPEIGFNNNIIQKGYESDDTIARYALDHGGREDIVIATADDDMLQLLDHAKIYNLYRNELYTAEKFRADYGIEPNLWVEVKKIAGCNSDNIPGVMGVGEKTAIKYLTKGLKESTKTFKDITASPEVIEFNHKLVKLPFPGTKRIEIVKDEFSMIAFLRMCRQFGMYSFRTESKKALIRKLFTGGSSDVQEKQKSRKRSRSKSISRKESGKGS